MRKHLLPFLVLLQMGPLADCEGQEQDLPWEEWTAQLAVKQDHRLEKVWSVFDQIIVLDSSVRCETLRHLESRGPGKNKRYQIRLSWLNSRVRLWDPICPGDRTIEAQLKDGLRMAYEIEDDFLIAVMNQELGEWYNRNGQFGLGITHGLVAKDGQEAIGVERFPGLPFARYHLGHMLYQVRDYATALGVFREAIRGFPIPDSARVETLDPYYTMNAWNNMGLCFRRMEVYDSAIWAFQHALDIAKSEKTDFWIGLIEGNMGDVFFSLGQYDTAKVLLSKDVRQSLGVGQFDNAANSVQLLAQIDVVHGKTLEGLEKLRDASQFLRQVPHGRVHANVYRAYTQVFSDLGKADSVYAYMQKYLTLHDSLERVAAHNSAEIVRLRLDNQESVSHILLLNKEKRRITLIRNFTVGIILLLAGLAYLDFNRQKAKMMLQNQIAREQQRLAKLEAATAREQLKDFTGKVIEKSELIDQLQQQLLQKEVTAEQHQMIVDLTHQQLLTDADWDKFKSLFERVYPGFFITLRDVVPEITLAELRMAALIRLQLTTKESAALLGVSLDSVHKTRQRLKQRLQLPPDADMDMHIRNL